MSELKALLFNVDGTLTKELHRQAFNLGWNWSDELYAELLAVSGGAERIAHYIDRLNRPVAERTRLRRLISAVHREKTRIYGTLIASNKALLGAGVGRLIEEAHEAGLKTDPTGRSGGGVRRIRGFDQWHRGHQGRPPRHGRDAKRWTKDRDFGDADLVVDSLGEPDMPLSPRDARASAERVGSGSRRYARPRNSCAPRACSRERVRC
jgi:hypothetical protein